MSNHEPEGLTRREALKRGAKLTGAVLWVTPVVQAVGMRPALAQAVSPTPCVNERCLRAKSNDDLSSFENSPGVGANDCTDCGGSSGIDGDQFLTISGDEDMVTVMVKDPNCRITSIVARGGNENNPNGDPCRTGTVAPDGLSATVTRPEAGGISHVEVCFCCCLDA